MHARRLVRLALGLAGALALAGCGALGPDSQEKSSGGVGGTPPPAAQGLSVPTQTLPAGRCDVTYPVTQLVATGATGPVEWCLVAGTLPSGLSLAANGTLAGTPRAKGVFAFDVCAQDDRSTVVRDMRLAVDTLLLETSGLRFGDAWSDVPVTLTAVGATGSMRFEVVSAPSGGRFLARDAGTAVWVPGTSGPAGATDVLRGTDDTGARAEASLRVMPHPAADHTAEISTTDVWYVDYDLKHGAHPFARDFDACLAAVGMRGASSTSADGEEADQLASFYVRREVLRALNRSFLRDPDGSVGAQGLPITFPMEEPRSYEKPAPGTWLTGGPWRYGVMAFLYGDTRGIIGTAYQDGPANAAHENDTTTTAAGSLGVFGDKMVAPFNQAWMNEALTDDPVDADDVPALRALVYGLAPTGGRYGEIARIGEGFGRVIASIAAHEIGHSIGLVHTNPTTPGSVMNAAATISPALTPRFTASDVDALRSALPGAGRSGIGKVSPALLPEGGVEACRLDEPTRPLPTWAVRSAR